MRQSLSDVVDALKPAKHAARTVVMVTSPGLEASLADVVINLATICAEVGLRVAIVGTAGLAVPDDGSQLALTMPLWNRSGWRSLGGDDGEPSLDDMRARLTSGPVDPADVEAALGDTGVPGVSRLDLRYFVAHPTQVVIRAPGVLAALDEIVDVVLLEVPSYLTVHHGEALTPLADAVLVVGERRTTTVSQVRRTKDTLKRLGAPVVGMALTRSRERTSIWGNDSDLDEELYDESDEVDDPTEQIPAVVSEPVGIVSSVRIDEGAAGDDTPPEA